MKRISLILLLIGLAITSIYAQEFIEIGDGTLTNQSLPMEPYFGITVSQTIYLQEWINNDIVISEIAYYYNGNSAWTEDNIQIWMAHTDLDHFTNTTDWVTQDQLLLVYDGPFTVPATEGWVSIILDLPFDYNNTQNLLVAFESNTWGYTASGDEFFCTSTTANHSLEKHNDSTNYDFINPPGGTLRNSFPNTRLTRIPGLISLSPINNATHISLTPTISLEVDERYSYFELCFGTTPNPETLLMNFSPVTNPITYTFTDSLEYHTDYYWTVNLYDINYEITTVNFTFKTRPEMEGLGTEESPYLVRTITDLIRISSDSYFWDKHYLQTADIDASTTSELNAGAGFSPIGNNDNYFTGSYDGQGYTISNLYINRPSTDYIGLFGHTNSAEISNLGIVDAEIVGNHRVGGLVGLSSSSTISNSYATGAVSGSSNIGGLVGSSSSTISNSYSTGAVSGNDYVGGLVGFSSSSNISNSYSTGAVSGNGVVGGLVGQSSSSTISNSYATGAVSGSYKVGGLVGLFNNSSTISNSYATGVVNGSSDVGGLVGYLSNGSVNNSFWDMETSGQTVSAGGTGKTTLEMNNLYTYLNAGWDFIGEETNGSEDIWYLHPTLNSGYPFFAPNQEDSPEYVPNFALVSYPNNGVINLATSDNLIWDPDYFELTSGYRIDLGTDNPPTNLVSNEDMGLVTSYEYSNLEPNTTYYWQVIPYNDNGDAEDCPIWSFTTGSTNLVSVGSGSDTTAPLPINHATKRSYSQSIYLQSELNLSNRQIEKLSFYLKSESLLTGANQWKVYLGHTDKTEFASANDWLLPSAGLTQVADVTLIDTTGVGWMEIELTTPFAYNNSDNLIVSVIEYNGETSNLIDFYTVDTESNRSLSFGHDSTTPNANIPYNGVLSTSIPKINFTFSETTTIFTGLVQNSQATPLTDANIFIEEFGNFPTNSLGEFNIHNVEAGTYQLIVSAPWYETQTLEYEVIEGENNYLEITLLEELLPANNVVATLAEDLIQVNITWSTPALSREPNLSKRKSSQTKENLIQKQELEERTGQPDLLYNLYRYGAGDEANPENWVEIITNLDALTYTDVSFPSLELGSYYWAVQAVYANDRKADPTISNEILKQPYLESNIDEQLDFGVVYLSNQSEYSEIILTNSGTGALTLSDISCEESAFNLLYDQADFVVETNASITIQVNFTPDSPGVYMEDLIITNNSTNEPNYTISLRGVCEYLPPAPPENVQVLMANNNANISWNAVTEDINNNVITPDLYIVYYNGQNTDTDNDFYFLASTPELSYNHVNVGLFSEFMFYRVNAYVDVNNVILSQLNDLVARKGKVRMKEIESLISDSRKKTSTRINRGLR